MTVNVVDWIMSTSIIFLDEFFNANDVDIMVFEPCVLFHPGAAWDEIQNMVRQMICRTLCSFRTIQFCVFHSPFASRFLAMWDVTEAMWDVNVMSYKFPPQVINLPEANLDES